MLLDQFDFFYYSNLSDFVWSVPVDPSFKTALLVGNPVFGKPPPDAETHHFFMPLPGTQLEIESIRKQLDEHDLLTYECTAHSARESNFYDLIATSKPNLLHLATHGFFFDQDTQTLEPSTVGGRLLSADRSLVRSGLALSNINLSWNQVSVDQSLDDGILTAIEISVMDLSVTNLVVLSACETGRGAVADGEGIFGLQRAFKRAGAAQLLISLWDVPDEPTLTLMTSFYDLLLQGLPPNQALLGAQRTARRQFPSPYDWGGFVIFQ